MDSKLKNSKNNHKKIKVHIKYPLALRGIFLYPSTIEKEIREGKIVKKPGGYFMKGS